MCWWVWWGGGTHGNTGGGGGGGGYSGGAGGRHDSNYGNGGGGGSYNNGSNQSNEAGIWDDHGKVVITACTGFCFESLGISNDNTYADLTLSAGGYNTNGGSGALEASDFSFTFSRNGGVATNATISSIKKNNNTSEGSASALTGGETVIRFFLNLTGTPVGIETITIAPANGSSIYNSSGTAMSSSASIQDAFTDKNGPYITAASINSDNTQVSVTLSETAYSTNGGSGDLAKEDFSLSISGGSASLSSATPTALSKSGDIYTLTFGVSGTASGQEVLTVSPVANSIYDASGNASTASQSNNTVFLYDKRLVQNTNLEHDLNYGVWNKLIKMDQNAFVLQYSGSSSDGYLQTFTTSSDGNTITQVLEKEWGTKNDVYYPSFIRMSEDTYLIAYYGYNSGIKHDGTSVSNTWGQWLSVFQIKSDGSVINELGNFLHDTYTNSDPYNDLIKIDDDTYALAYKSYNYGPQTSGSWGGWIKTFKVNGGNINQVNELQHYTSSDSYWHSWERLSATTYALAWQGSGGDGYITTFTISTDGATITEIAELEHDGNNGSYNSFAKLDDDTYVLAYTGDGSDGHISTFTIPTNGASITKVATLEHDNSYGIFNSLVRIDQNKFMLAYKASDNDGHVKMFTIPDDGSSITEALTFEHETSYNQWNSLQILDYDNFILAYEGSSNDGYIKTFNYPQIATSTLPRISTSTIAANNSTIAVTFNEPVFNTTGGSGNLEASDFSLALSGGNATLASATPTSISASGNTYTLGMNLSGEASGFEKITVTPVNDGIFDASDNEATTTQLNNEVYLRAIGAPIITATSVDAYNTKLTVKFLKPIFNTNSGSGLPEVSDFSLALSGGTATLTSATPTSISGRNGPELEFTFSTSGVADGNETITITPVQNALWDIDGTVVSNSQSNNTATLNASFMNPITNFEHNSGNATHNSMIHISGDVYAIAYEGSNNKGTIQTISITSAGGVTNSSYIASEEHDDNNGEYNQLVHLAGTKYVLFYRGQSSDGFAKVFNISNNGQTIEAISSALEFATNDAQHISALKITDSTLVAAWQRSNDDNYITTFKVSSDGSSITSTVSTNHDGSYGRSNSLVRADEDTYILSYNGSSNYGRVQTFTIPPDGSSITEVANAAFSDNSYSYWNSMIQIDHDTYVNAGYSYNTSGANGYYGVLETFTIPLDGSSITSVATLKYTDQNLGTHNKLFKLNDSEFLLAYEGKDGDGYLEMYSVSSNGATLTKKWQNEFDISNMEWPSITRLDKNTIAIAYAGGSSDGYIQTFDIGTSDNTGPAITFNSLNYDNNQLTVGLNEKAYDANSGSGDLEVGDFALSITNGVATIGSATPTSISRIGDHQYVLGFSLSGTPNGSEQLAVVPIANSIFDINGTASSTSQSNNTVNLFEKVLPTISSTALAADNSTITATFSEAVFKSRSASGTGFAGNGDLEVSDFVLSMSGGVATLGSATPTSISKSSNAYTLGINYIGLPNGSEVITVIPAQDAIYDNTGNIASTTQSNNTKTFNSEKIRIAKSLEFETGYAQFLSLLKRDADTYIAAFMYNSNDRNGDGYLSAFNISADGETLTEVNVNNSSRWQWESNDYAQGNWVQVDTNTFALAFWDYGNGGYINTFDISADGSTVSEKKQRFQFSASTSTWDGYYNSFIKLSSSIYVIAYQDNSNRGVIATFTISDDGNTIVKKDSEYYISGGGSNNYMAWNSLVKIDDNTVANAHSGASGGAEGWITTYNIDPSSGDITGASGSQNTYVNRLKHDNVQGKFNSLVHLGSDKYVLAYAGSGDDGYLTSFTISADGATITEIEQLEHDTNRGFYNKLITISEEAVLLVYSGDDNDGGNDSYDGYIKSISINSNGTGISVSATDEFETQKGEYTDIADIDGNTFAVVSEGYGSDGFIRTFNVRASDQSAPTITSRSLAADNATIAVTFNEDVYAVSNGTGDLQTSDFELSISGGSATLSSTTPTSISRSGNVYTLGIGLNSPASGTETITVKPVANSIFDLAGNISVTNQSNNTATLNDKLGPSITGIVITNDNSSVNVTLAETAYPGTANSGALTADDWVLSIPDTNSTAKLGSATPTSIAKSGNTYTLGLNIVGTPDGAEVLKVSPAANSIYDALDNISSTTQSNNTANLKDKAPATITAVNVSNDNTSVAVTISEAVYSTNNGSGDLEKGDFTFTMSGGAASLSSATPTTISKSGNVYTLGFGLSGTPSGAEIINVSPVANSIYDALGNISLTSQSNNTANLKDKAKPIISNLELANNNGTIAVTFSESVFSNNNGSGDLDSLDFVLSMSGSGASLSQANPTTISKNGNIYTLGIGLNGTPTGAETLIVKPALNAIYDSSGNTADTTQAGNSKTLNDKFAPTITAVAPSSDNTSIVVSFSETVFKASNGNGDLEVSDFKLSMSGGRAILKSATPTSISKSGNNYTLGIDVSGTGTGKEVIAAIPIASSIYDNAGNVALSTQASNTTYLKDLSGPIIVSMSPENQNNNLVVTFDEPAFTSSNGTGILDTSDVTLTLTGGTATLITSKPDTITQSGNAYTFDLDLNGKVNGFEVLKFQLAFNAVYDSLGNVANPIQTISEVNLIDQTAPTFAKITMENDNSAVNVKFSNPVFNKTGGSGSLEKEDFVLKLEGGTATLDDSTPNSIAYIDSTSSYQLSISITGTPDGYEKLTVSPSANSIYDAADNIANTEQAINSTNLIDKALPVIKSIDIASSNASVTVNLSEPVFSTAFGIGELSFADFLLTIAGGTANLPLPFPDGITKTNDSTFVLGIKTEGIQSGREQLTVRPSPGAVYDRAGNAADFFSQQNNIGRLNDKQLPIRPTGLVAIPGDRKVSLGWNLSNDPDIAKYYIYYDTNSDPTTLRDSTLSAFQSNKLITPLINGTTYYFKVAAVDSSNNISIKTLGASASPIKGSVYTVKTDTSGGFDFSRIQDAINVSKDIDTVLIYPGNYKGGINFTGKKIVVGSLFLTTGDTAYIDSTVIDGEESTSAATFISGEDSTSVLVGLSLTNGYTTINGGGGIRIENSDPRLKNLKVFSNFANIGGGGISCEACDSRITNVTINNNSSSGKGGGIRIFNGSNPELINVAINSNSATEQGGGISIEGLPGNNIDLDFNRLTVQENTSATVGGGIYLYISKLNLSRAFLMKNSASTKGGGISIEWDSDLTIENSFILGNTLTAGDQGSNIYIGKSDQIIGSTEKLQAININVIDTVSSNISMYSNGLIKPLLINSINVGKLDAAVPTYNFDLNYSYCDDCTNLLTFTTNPGNLTGDLPFIDMDKENFELTDDSPLLSAATLSFTTIAGKTYDAPSVDLNGRSRPNPIGSILDIGAIESEFSGKTLAATGITDGLSISSELDFSNITSTLSSRWNPYLNDSLNTYTYEFAIGDSSSSNNVKDWTNNGFNTQVTVSGLNLQNSVTYYFSVRVLNKNGTILSTMRTDGVLIDTQKPVISGIHDGSDNDIDWYGLDSEGTVIFNVIDNSGVNIYEFSIGTTPGERDVLNWQLVQDSVGTFSTKDFVEEATYYVNGRVTDRVGYVSDVVSSDGFQMDFTNPTAGNVAIDNPFQSNINALSFSWDGFKDGQSGMDRYDIMIGTEAGKNDISPRVSTNSLTNVTIDGLSLENNGKYYGTIFGIDSVGNESSSSSESITIDLIPPTVGTVADGLDSDGDWFNDNASASANWTGFSDFNGIKEYFLSIGTEKGNPNIQDWTSTGADTSFTFTELGLINNTLYYFNVRASDQLGNVSESVSSDGFYIDTDSPQISSSSADPSVPLTIIGDLSIDMTLTEEIFNYNVNVSSLHGDIVAIDPKSSLRNNNTTLNIMLTSPFTSGDQLTIEISLSDSAGNSSADINYIYNVAYLSDFDQDGQIDITDVNNFSTAWNEKDYSKELAPVTGSAPYFTPAPDGVFDVRDGMAFVRMWQWSNSSSNRMLARRGSFNSGASLDVDVENDHLLITPPKSVRAVELIANYAPYDIALTMSDENVVSSDAISLVSSDTLSGSLLIHTARYDQTADPIRIDVKHLQKEMDVPVTLSYRYLGVDGEEIAAGSETIEIVPVPTDFALHNNYPNPFNPTTSIDFDLPEDGNVVLMIYDVMGREVATLQNSEMKAGYHSVRWDARNQMGRKVAAGVYFYQIKTARYLKTRKMVLLK